MTRPALMIVIEGTWPLGVGGIGSWLQDLLEGLADCSVHVVRIGGALPAPGHWDYRPPSCVRSVRALAPPALLDAVGLDAWTRRARPRLPDVDRALAVGAGLAAALADSLHRATSLPYVLSEHASYVHELACGNPRLECGRVVPPGSRAALLGTFAGVARGAYATADAVLALDEGTRRRQRAAGAPAARTFVVPNGVPDAPAALPSPHRRSPLRVQARGRIHRLKGQDLLLTALEHRPDLPVEVDIVGPFDDDDDFCARVRRAAAHDDRVTLHGRRARGDWTPRPDLLVLPSRSEAQPLVALEAMARGIPVLCTDVGDCRGVVGSGETAAGWVVPPTAGALAGALAELCTADARAALTAAGRAGRARFEARHTTAAMVAAIRRHLLPQVGAGPTDEGAHGTSLHHRRATSLHHAAAS